MDDMDTMTTAPTYHLDWTEVDCPECEAAPGQACTSLWYGNGYVVTDGHPARHEAASYHWYQTRVQEGIIIVECHECGHVEDVN